MELFEIVDIKNIIIWGRSLGGYLVTRAYAYEKRLKACVADGGVYDFF